MGTDFRGLSVLFLTNRYCFFCREVCNLYFTFFTLLYRTIAALRRATSATQASTKAPGREGIMSSYTAADAVSDVDCILRDFQCSFVMDPWMTVSHFQDSILGAGTSPSAASSVQDLPSVCRKVSDHNDSVKYLKFVTDAFMCESSNVSRQGKDKDRNIPTTTATTPAAPLDITTPLNQTEFLQQIPFSVSVSKIVQNNSVLRDMCNSEITEKQLQKDIERDQLVIDGQRIIGSNDGLEKCLLAVGDAVDSCLVSCFLPSLGPDLRAEVARVVLATVSRTNSGGVALHTLRSITGGPC